MAGLLKTNWLFKGTTKAQHNGFEGNPHFQAANKACSFVF
jgi:hypothetical protein